MLGLDIPSPYRTGELEFPVYRPSQRVFGGLHAFEGIPLGLSFASAQETLFQDFSLKREPFLFGKASRRPPVDLVRVFRRSVQGFTKSLPESAPGSFPGGPSYNPYACQGWQGF